MIRLALPTESYWIDLVSGVRVKVRPCDMTVYTAALNSAREGIAKIVADAGSDETLRNAMIKARFALELAKYAIEEWEGLAGPDDKPAEITPENIAQFVRVPGLGSAFFDQYTSTAALLVTEGNA